MCAYRSAGGKAPLPSLIVHLHQICVFLCIIHSYYARVYMAKMDLHGAPQGEEVDVDARPSDAINLAIRAGVRDNLCVRMCVCTCENAYMHAPMPAITACPSDAIILAIHSHTINTQAPMFVSEKVAMTAIEPEKVLSEFAASILSTSAQSDIERSVRETLTHFEVSDRCAVRVCCLHSEHQRTV